jgi:hypothetical protein
MPGELILSTRRAELVISPASIHPQSHLLVGGPAWKWHSPRCEVLSYSPGDEKASQLLRFRSASHALLMFWHMRFIRLIVLLARLIR